MARTIGDQTMIETVLFLALILGLGAAVVKLYERSQDVLYGPYLRPDDRSEPH
jgi:hypothetical protein